MKISKHSIIASTITAVAAVGISLIPSNSEARGSGYHNNTKQHTIVSFQKNVARLNVMAQSMVSETQVNRHSRRSFNREDMMTAKAVTRHATLTKDLVKATHGSNPMTIRQSAQAVDSSIKSLKYRQVNSIKHLLKSSEIISNNVINSVRDFNLAKNNTPTRYGHGNTHKATPYNKVPQKVVTPYNKTPQKVIPIHNTAPKTNPYQSIPRPNPYTTPKGHKEETTLGNIFASILRKALK